MMIKKEQQIKALQKGEETKVQEEETKEQKQSEIEEDEMLESL